MESALDELESIPIPSFSAAASASGQSWSSSSSSHQGHKDRGPMPCHPRNAEGAAPDARHGAVEGHTGAVAGGVAARGEAGGRAHEDRERGRGEAVAGAPVQGTGAVLAGNADVEAARAELLFHRASYEESYGTSKRWGSCPWLQGQAG